MADLAKFQQETTAAYQPAYTSLQNQLGQLDKKLASTKEDIANQYAQQQAGLNRQRNQAAENASMQAAGSGGSFGGAANIANRKYYEQTFTPALQNINANEAAAYKAAQEARDNSYDSLNNQLAQLQAEANKYALQRYDAAVEAERQAAEAERNRQAQLAASRAANSALSYLGGGGSGDKYGRIDGTFKFRNNETGAAVRLGTYINQFGGNFNQRARDYLASMASAGNKNAKEVLDLLKRYGNAQLAWSGGGGINNYSGATAGQKALNALGLKMVDSNGNLLGNGSSLTLGVRF